jgi:thiol:disulfide interchange protein DsbA
MRLIQHRRVQHLLLGLGLTLGLSFSLFATTAAASPTAPVNAVDYRTLAQPLPTDSGKKVEVTEFFWYDCPHCNAFDPSLEAWVKKQGDRINFKRVPVIFRDSFIPQQKLYYALEAMGKVDALHTKIFHAIHVERQQLDTDKQIADFIAKQKDIDAKQFAATYNSFGVATKVRRAKELQADYKVDGVPLLAIDGRYLTSPAIVSTSMGNSSESELFKATLQVADALVTRAARK